MASDSACDFLAATETRYFYIPDDEKKHPALDLLLRKKHRELLELVTEGAVSVKETLHPLNVSLLELSLKRNPVLNDVSVLLDALKLKGEKLEEVHLDRACTCASPALIQLLLSHGAPLGPNALHCLVERFPFGANKQAVLESINLVIKANAEIDALGSSPFSSVTPLTTASGALSLPKEVIQCLLDFRADPLGGKGTRSPLHAHVAQWGSPAGVELLVKNRADLNARDASGKTPVHIALAGHPKFNLAMCLKSLGADVTVADHQGVTPRQILLKHNSPAQAAELEGRSELNAEELRLQQALDHPLAKKFQASAFAAVSWILSRTPEDGFGGICNNELTEDFPYGDRRLSECLGGHVPKHLVLQLPLTRYSELLGDLCLKSPEPEGFTVRGVLMEIYKFYQEPFSKEELSSINAHYGRGCLGDTFGYIQTNVAEDEGQEQQKKQRVPRLNLRGDSIFFEGFRSCKYFEDDQSLWGTLSLGS